MTINFKLPMRPFSINQAYSRDIRFKTAAYKSWASEALHRLSLIPELATMGKQHKAKGGTFEVSIVVVYPESEFYNKSGAVSSKIQDLSNFEKLLLDLIWGHTMGVNDKYVTTLVSHKCAVGGTEPCYIDTTIVLKSASKKQKQRFVGPALNTDPDIAE